jgi:hypothetical protein
MTRHTRALAIDHRRMALLAAGVLFTALTVGTTGTAALAYWRTGDGQGVAATATLSMPGTPTVSVGSSVEVRWSPAISTADVAPAYHVQRRALADATWVDACGTTVAGPTTLTSCVDSPSSGTLVYRVAAVLGSWSTSSLQSEPVQVGIRHLGTSTATTTGSGATSLTIALPPGVRSGDVLLAQVAFRVGSAAGSDAALTPAGWNLAGRADNGDQVGQVILWRVATGADASGSVTVSFAQSTRAAGAVLRYAGAHPTTPIVDAAASTGRSTTLQAPPALGAAGGRLVALWSMNRSDAITVPGSMTMLADAAAQNHAAVRAADETTTEAGPTGARLATTGTIVDWVGHSLTLRPA